MAGGGNDDRRVNGMFRAALARLLRLQLLGLVWRIQWGKGKGERTWRNGGFNHGGYEMGTRLAEYGGGTETTGAHAFLW